MIQSEFKNRWKLATTIGMILVLGTSGCTAALHECKGHLDGVHIGLERLRSQCANLEPSWLVARRSEAQVQSPVRSIESVLTAIGNLKMVMEVVHHDSVSSARLLES